MQFKLIKRLVNPTGPEMKL